MELFRKKVLWLVGLLLLLLFLYHAQEGLVVLFMAFIFASAFLPFVEWLDKRCPRWLSVSIPFTVFTVISLLVLLPTLHLATAQLHSLVINMPIHLEEIRHWLERLDFWGREYPLIGTFPTIKIMEQISSHGVNILSGFTGITIFISKWALNILTAVIISFFLLYDREKIKEYYLRWVPGDHKERFVVLMDHLSHRTGAFFNGQILFMASYGAMIALGLTWLHIPYALLLGIVTGVLSLIPVLGPNLVMVPVAAFAWALAPGTLLPLWVFLMFMGVQLFENHITGPLIWAKAVGLHPIVIILALLLGALMDGVVGIILSVPIASCINVILEEWVLVSPSSSSSPSA